MFNYSNYGYSPNYGSTANYMQRAYAPQPPQIPPQQAQTPPPIQMPAQPQIAPQTPQIQDVRYGTEEEAKAFIVIPNCIAYFIDTSKNRLYAKTANASGISSIDYFSLTQINADGTPIQPQESPIAFNPENFVTIDEFKALSEQFAELKKMLSAKPQFSTKKTEKVAE